MTELCRLGEERADSKKSESAEEQSDDAVEYFLNLTLGSFLHCSPLEIYCEHYCYFLVKKQIKKETLVESHVRERNDMRVR